MDLKNIVDAQVSSGQVVVEVTDKELNEKKIAQILQRKGYTVQSIEKVSERVVTGQQ